MKFDTRPEVPSSIEYLRTYVFLFFFLSFFPLFFLLLSFFISRTRIPKNDGIIRDCIVTNVRGDKVWCPIGRSLINQFINSTGRAIINSTVRERRINFEVCSNVWKSASSLTIPVAELHVWRVTCNLLRKISVCQV